MRVPSEYGSTAACKSGSSSWSGKSARSVDSPPSAEIGRSPGPERRAASILLHNGDTGRKSLAISPKKVVLLSHR